MKPPNVSPTLCPECGQRFPPGGPEPSCCPHCRRLWTGYDESGQSKPPIPNEALLTPEERVSWRTGFWVFFLMGPILAAALMLFKWDILPALPASLRPFAKASSQPVLLLCLSAAGAGLCLANMRFAYRRFADKLAYSFLIGIDVLAVYGGMLLVGGLVMRALMSNPIQ